MPEPIPAQGNTNVQPTNTPSAQPGVAQPGPAQTDPNSGSQSPLQSAGAPQGGAQPPAGGSPLAAAGSTDPNAQSAEPPAKPEPIPDDFTFTLPEGIQPNQALTAAFIKKANEFGWTKEQAQAVVDLQTQQLVEDQQQWTQMKEEWGAESRKLLADKTFDANVARARGVVKNPEVWKLLEETGFDHHPVMLSLFAEFGAAMGEDRLVPRNGNPGAPGQGSTKSDAELFYPNMYPNK